MSSRTVHLDLLRVGTSYTSEAEDMTPGIRWTKVRTPRTAHNRAAERISLTNKLKGNTTITGVMTPPDEESPFDFESKEVVSLDQFDQLSGKRPSLCLSLESRTKEIDEEECDTSGGGSEEKEEDDDDEDEDDEIHHRDHLKIDPRSDIDWRDTPLTRTGTGCAGYDSERSMETPSYWTTTTTASSGHKETPIVTPFYNGPVSSLPSSSSSSSSSSRHSQALSRTISSMGRRFMPLSAKATPAAQQPVRISFKTMADQNRKFFDEDETGEIGDDESDTLIHFDGSEGDDDDEDDDPSFAEETDTDNPSPEAAIPSKLPDRARLTKSRRSQYILRSRGSRKSYNRNLNGDEEDEFGSEYGDDSDENENENENGDDLDLPPPPSLVDASVTTSAQFSKSFTDKTSLLSVIPKADALPNEFKKEKVIRYDEYGDEIDSEDEDSLLNSTTDEEGNDGIRHPPSDDESSVVGLDEFSDLARRKHRRRDLRPARPGEAFEAPTVSYAAVSYFTDSDIE